MNVLMSDPNIKASSFDTSEVDISKSSIELAKNLRNHLGYKAACKTCEQNQWNGVLTALHILNDEKSSKNER